MTDFATTETCAWFDGNIQKMASVSASILTAEFNRQRLIRDCGIESGDKYKKTTLAYFDSRVFTIPDRTEVMNYFIWRENDCLRNSVSMLSQHYFPHKELQGKSTVQMKEMMEKYEAGAFSWDLLNDSLIFGRMIVKEECIDKVVLPKTEKQLVKEEMNGIYSTPYQISCPRAHWVSKSAWKFTEYSGVKLLNMIPKYE